MSKMLKLAMILLIISSSVVSLGFSQVRKTPQQVYRVYLQGKSLGLIKSKKSLEDYIDKKQTEIKKKYKVDKVYKPDDLDIVKEITYDEKLISVKKIYNKIKDISPFTINGYVITIKGVNSQDSEGKEVTGKSQKIYVLDRKVFEAAINNTVHSFIPEADYIAFAENTQKEIEDVGEVITSIYLQNKITIKKQNIPVNETIYMDTATLSQYLLFGTTEKQKTYVVQDGDTIEDVSFNNKVSTSEFLIANPEFTSENSLLYPGQEVTIGVLKPQVNVAEETYRVIRTETNYQTETRYDNSMYENQSKVIQAGVKGENKVTQEVLFINGVETNVVPVESKVIKEPITEIIVKGTKQWYYTGGGYGVPPATRGQWGWPASCMSISSHFGWRWGILHDGTDISGCGYGSNIFAAQDGIVVESRKKPGYYAGGYGDNGEYVLIDHQNGYYTIYAHLCPGCRYVQPGDKVVKGQLIGGMGRTGAATGVHLHFGMWYGYPYRGGQAVNAMHYY